MQYNLTDAQKNLIKEIVSLVQSGSVDEEFNIVWSGNKILGYEAALVSQNKLGQELSSVTKSGISALVDNGLLSCSGSASWPTYSLTGESYKAIETDFDSPDTSFIKYVEPLGNVDNFDKELKDRCIPILATGGSESILWDSVVRTAGVILEERLRDVGLISDPSKTGNGLVNSIFNEQGTLASKFTIAAERQGYRDLYAGIVGAFRNPSAHKFIDPTPEDGGAFLVFVNLLLKKLEALR